MNKNNQLMPADVPPCIRSLVAACIGSCGTGRLFACFTFFDNMHIVATPEWVHEQVHEVYAT